MRSFFLLSFLAASAAFAAPTTIELPKGRWARKAENGAHLVFRGLTNAVIEAIGCDLVCGDVATAVLFEDCAEVTLRGLAVDYDLLPFSEGRVEQVDADGTLHVRLAQGYPDTRRLSLFKGQLYSAEGELLPPRGGLTDLRKTGPETLTVKWRGAGKVAPGCIFVTDVEAVPFDVFARNPDNTAMRFHAVLKKNCRNVRFEGVTVYASHWFGFYEKDCEGSVFENCAVCPRDQRDDPVKRGLPRLRATNADGFHLRRASGRPRLLNCRVDGTEDDMLNIHGDFHFVTQGDSAAWRVLSQDRFNISPGDQVEVVPSGGGKRFFAKVRSVKSDGVVTDEERKRLSGVEMRAYFRWHWVPEAYRVELEGAPQVAFGSVIVSCGHVGAGFLVKGCRFGRTHCRGAKIRASGGMLVDNQFEGNGGVWLDSECWWLEGGYPDDVKLEGNTFKRCTAEVFRGPGVGLGCPAARNR